MNLVAQRSRNRKLSTRWSRGIVYGVLLLAAMVSLPLGMLAAAMGAWFAIQGGSLIYLPVGLALLLTGLAVVRSPSIAGFALSALLLTAVIGWSISGNDARSRLVDSVVELSAAYVR